MSHSFTSVVRTGSGLCGQGDGRGIGLGLGQGGRPYEGNRQYSRVVATQQNLLLGCVGVCKEKRDR